ncbi:YWFCY domain-containing protein [Chitinophaga sp. NPDC101104]|uniref:YWFCY domain-containing protein n=1 Tax=Chitinophaga sp. NPDC101104 TaxID=3390561 RepID=UPI003CFEA3B8
MNTGENEQGLRQATDLIRKASIILLGTHCYLFCYGAFHQLGLTAEISDKLLAGFSKHAVINNIHISKLFILVLLSLSVLGNKGKKDEKINKGSVVALLIGGCTLFFGSTLITYLTIPVLPAAVWYILFTITGFLLALSGAARLSRLVKIRLRKDIFNLENESFPQDEKLRDNEFSINIPATFRWKGKIRRSFINVINPFRALLITGVPGSR